ncbi:hypothetical protein PAMP_003663 [Pampus punctatissimus]
MSKDRAEEEEEEEEQGGHSRMCIPGDNRIMSGDYSDLSIKSVPQRYTTDTGCSNSPAAEAWSQINISVTSYGADGNWLILLARDHLFSNYKQHWNRTESYRPVVTSMNGNQQHKQPDTCRAAERKA